jgi:hypothetical protein
MTWDRRLYFPSEGRRATDFKNEIHFKNKYREDSKEGFKQESERKMSEIGTEIKMGTTG